MAHVLAFHVARASDSRTTSAPSSVGGTSFRLPPKVPMAVRRLQGELVKLQDWVQHTARRW
jgi:hypothetical protein